MKNAYLFLVAFSMLTLSVTAQNTNLLVDSDWLKEKMNNNNLVIFQVGNEEEYKKEHIPGAVFLSPSEFTYSDDHVKVFDLPSIENLKKLLESKGVSNTSEVVIYAGNYIPTMTRFYFTLNYLGLGNKTHILDGGLALWKANGGTVTAKIPTPKKGIFNVKPDELLVADKAYVRSIIGNDATTIIDCRASVYYQGIDVNTKHGNRKGHITGAKTIPYTSLWEASGKGVSRFKSLNDIASIFKEQGLEKEQGIVLYCHIGLQLTVVYTAAKMLGYKDIKIYDASFHEWGADKSLPVSID